MGPRFSRRTAGPASTARAPVGDHRPAAGALDPVAGAGRIAGRPVPASRPSTVRRLLRLLAPRDPGTAGGRELGGRGSGRRGRDAGSLVVPSSRRAAAPTVGGERAPVHG